MTLSINELVRGNRVFKEETEEGDRYLVLDANKIQKCIYFDYVILIKPGDLPFPQKWTRYFRLKPEKGQVVPIEQYNRDDYEYIFTPDFALTTELKNELETLGYATDDSNKGENFLIQLDEIPENLLLTVKRDIEIDMKATEEPRVVDCYVYEKDGEAAYFITEVDSMDNIGTILDDSTVKFQNIETLEIYETPSKDKRLYKAKDTTEPYRSERWYIYSDEDKNFPYFNELYELEDLIPYTAFRKCSPKVVSK